MASTSETGHSKNLANLKLLKDLLSQIGADYSPINNQLTVSSFATLIANCEADYDNWIDKLTTYKDVTDLREIAFEPLNKLVTSINQSVQQLNEPQQTFNDIQAIVHKIHGDSKKIKSSTAYRLANPDPTIPVTEPNPTITDPISTSQRSYDSIITNFDKLIKRLQTIPAFIPNETELQIATLQAQYNQLEILNANAGTADNALSISRNQRNLSFYAPQTGMYDIVLKTKKYLRSNKKTMGAIYSQATKLKFVKIVQRKKKKKAPKKTN